MTSRPIADDAVTDLYEADYVAWVERQAAAILDRRVADLEWERLADEVGDLARMEQNRCRRLVSAILLNLIRLEFSSAPAERPNLRGDATRDRYDLTYDLSPTVVVRLSRELPTLLRTQLDMLAAEGDLPRPQEVVSSLGGGYTWEQITDIDFLPQPQG